MSSPAGVDAEAGNLAALRSFINDRPETKENDGPETKRLS
ncbi:MAG: hypothetical protein QOC99_1865 [Acidobacteriota bacterium]|jgi:hypothetical protein|nr:hypothetical protein [Acidobacteriota bacterium]MDT7779353.1 hypothetical protein [Acidobacteriota bacterium]